jgi:hypothetical protein
MRLAVSGTHGVGKTTLVEDFLAAHSRYGHEPEPYHALAELGVAFADEPDAGDYLRQLEHSVATLLARSSEPDVIFDRCPLDFVAYLLAVGGRAAADAVDALLDEVAEAVHTLDLVVYLPLASPDPTGGAGVEQPVLRRRVDRRLAAILHDDTLELLGAGRPRLLELAGSPSARLKVLERAVGIGRSVPGTIDGD